MLGCQWSANLKLFGDLCVRLERIQTVADVRESILPDVVKLVGADFAASYVWNGQTRRFENGVIHNMEPANIARYEEWFQFHDPHTLALRARKRTTHVEEITPFKVLQHTEFYNDFLRRDGLHHGINLFLFDGSRDLGDFRLWRAECSPEFTDQETMLLDALASHVQRALIRANNRFDQLTFREREICALVAKGCRDREIEHMLGISFSTVRTHINKAMLKRGCANRAELAVSFTRELA